MYTIRQRGGEWRSLKSIVAGDPLLLGRGVPALLRLPARTGATRNTLCSRARQVRRSTADLSFRTILSRCSSNRNIRQDRGLRKTHGRRGRSGHFGRAVDGVIRLLEESAFEQRHVVACGRSGGPWEARGELGVAWAV